jgi:signal transduction histidine kinase
MLLFYDILPYFFLMSAIALYPMSKKWYTAIALLAAVPSIGFVGSHLLQYPTGIDISILQPWAVLYLGGAPLLYLAAWLKEKDPASRRNLLRLNVVFTPIIIWSLLKDFIYTERITLTADSLVMSNPDWHLKGNPIELWLFLLLLIYSIRSGFLGIKVRIEQQSLDTSMRTISYGTTLINHAIKNDVQKLDYLLEKLEELAQAGKTGDILPITQRMSGITRQLQQMSGEIKEKSQVVTLHEQTVLLSEVLQPILRGLEVPLRNRSIRLDYRGAEGLWVRCDPRRIGEVFTNLCVNAMESIEHDRGVIQITTRVHKRGFDIEVRDNGKGIDSHYLGAIFEPFFTTKKQSERNYGLGLSYAFHIMQKHGGKVSLVESRLHEGSLFRMRFPKRCIAPRKGEAGCMDRTVANVHAQN